VVATMISRKVGTPVFSDRTEFSLSTGKEMHEPDRMYLNPSQIVFVETVGTNSKVAQLIAQAPH